MLGFRVRVAVEIAALAAILSATTALAAWESFHADGANRGFVAVATKPAASGSRSVPNLGTFAPGAGPVIAPDGTVYLGTMEGKLIALHADGSHFWSRDIHPGEAIIASPAVGADGSVLRLGGWRGLAASDRAEGPGLRDRIEHPVRVPAAVTAR